MRKYIIIALISLFSVIGLVFLFRRQIEYYFQSIVLANRSTVFFSCNQFDSSENLEMILEEMQLEELKQLENYLNEVDGFIFISEVGPRCSNKYQFEVTFNGDGDRIKIEEILGDQRIGTIPVFLHNI